MNCSWCVNPLAEDNDGTLCRMHEAENEGVSVASLDRRDAIQYAEWLDTQG